MHIIRCPYCQFELSVPFGVQSGRELLCLQCRQSFSFVPPAPEPTPEPVAIQHSSMANHCATPVAEVESSSPPVDDAASAASEGDMRDRLLRFSEANVDDATSKDYSLLASNFSRRDLIEYAATLKNSAGSFIGIAFLFLIAGIICIVGAVNNAPKMVGISISTTVFLFFGLLMFSMLLKALSFLMASILHSSFRRDR